MAYRHFEYYSDANWMGFYYGIGFHALATSSIIIFVEKKKVK
jgi:hypothetical protein